MKSVCLIFVSLVLFGGVSFAQVISAAPDSVEIPQGIIFVQKPHITPFVKVDYKLFLSRVRMQEVLVPVNNGIENYVERDNRPVFDSSIYPKSLERVYPKKNPVFSKYFVENLDYQYQASDTPRVDTMVIGMWIDRFGKVKRVMPDTDYTGEMPRALVTELAAISWGINDWGEKGGYKTKKKLFRPSQLVIENYYCEAYVIVSSYPLTDEQKKTGTSYALFDYPLNSPAADAQQQASMDKNRGEGPLK